MARRLFVSIVLLATLSLCWSQGVRSQAGAAGAAQVEPSTTAIADLLAQNPSAASIVDATWRSTLAEAARLDLLYGASAGKDRQPLGGTHIVAFVAGEGTITVLVNDSTVSSVSESAIDAAVTPGFAVQIVPMSAIGLTSETPVLAGSLIDDGTPPAIGLACSANITADASVLGTFAWYTLTAGHCRTQGGSVWYHRQQYPNYDTPGRSWTADNMFPAGSSDVSAADASILALGQSSTAPLSASKGIQIDDDTMRDTISYASVDNFTRWGVGTHICLSGHDAALYINGCGTFTGLASTVAVPGHGTLVWQMITNTGQYGPCAPGTSGGIWYGRDTSDSSQNSALGIQSGFGVSIYGNYCWASQIQAALNHYALQAYH